jgi:hypothetical protein
MGLFSKKTNEEKIIEDMKKKKEQMDKLKEEINKMGKLVLKDGKLTKVDDVAKVDSKVPTMESPPIPQAQSFDNIDVDEMVQAERMRRQQQQPVQSNQARLQVSSPSITQDEYQYKLQQEMAAYQRLQQQAQQQAQLEQQAQQEANQREMLRQQTLQQQYRPPVQELPSIGIIIEMVTGSIIKVNVPGDRVESFIEGLSTAIDNQSSFPITSKVINGRNVVSFTVE